MAILVVTTLKAIFLKSALSARELQVLTLASQGFTDNTIAHNFGIQPGTVNSYWVRIRGKLGNLSRSELVARFVQGKAEAAHDQYVAHADAQSEILADENRDLLAKANEEIERLKKLLEKEDA